MAISVTKNQPEKLARSRGTGRTRAARRSTSSAGWTRAAEKTYAIGVPCLLSFLSYGSFDATVPGIEKFPKDDWAPVNLAFQATT
jgi:Cytochrome bd-type quinol oxidase, subunit 1